MFDHKFNQSHCTIQILFVLLHYDYDYPYAWYIHFFDCKKYRLKLKVIVTIELFRATNTFSKKHVLLKKFYL